jgi:RNA polymerase sigma-70 factor, ECF subfamily
VSYLRLVPPPVARAAVDDACLGAFQRELDYVHRTFRRLGTAPSEVEDLVQDLFLVLRRSWSAYDQERPLRPYLFGIAFRISLAHQRKRKREVAFGIVKVTDTGPGPDDVLASKQSRALLLEALEQVPLLRRAVLVMHEIDEVPVAQVASALSIPLFTVYSRLRKGRRELEAAVRRFRRAAEAG